MKKILLQIFVLLFAISTNAQNPLLLKDVFPGSTGSGIQQIVKTSNYTFFNAEDDDADADRGLYRTDGTPGGTIKLNLDYRAVTPGYVSTKAEKLTALGNKIIFTGDNFPNYGEIWASDGTQAGTIALERFQPTQAGRVPVMNMTKLGLNVLYGVVDNSNHSLLKKTDGTAAGTSVLFDFSTILPGAPDLALFQEINGILYFNVYNTGGAGEDQLWRSDGTTAGTYLLKDFGLNQYVASGYMPAGTLFYLMIVTPGTGNVLWKTDGTAAGTEVVKTIGTTGNNNYPQNVAIGSTLYFAGLDGNGKELWKTDGTTSGTVMVADIFSGAGSSNPNTLTILNNNVYFSATTINEGTELWKYDGVNASLVKDINPGTAASSPGSLVVSNNTILMRASTATAGSELWITDGTAANTLQVTDINLGTANATPNLLTAGNPIYFSAINNATGSELYKFDNNQALAGLHKIYVNDNSQTGDVFTTAIGNNANQGTKSEPVATISYALTIAQTGDTIIVDAGTYTEQVIIDKGITIKGAGQNLTAITTPTATLVPAPGPFTEIGLIETTQGIGDVHISDLSVTSNNTNSSQNIIIQSGGSVKNCKLLNGRQGIFFRIESGARNALVENNEIQPNGIGVNCQGSTLTARILNNTISNAAGYYAGIFAGLDFGPIVQLTVTNNVISNYFGNGLLTNSYTSSISQNSITGTGSLAIQQLSGNVLNATCNWFGTADAEIIKSKISGAVNYATWLISGTDTDPVALGFQPAAGTCTGRQNKFYVNDNSQTGDVFTTAIGNNANNGFSIAPFATINYAVSQAQAGDSIYVDAGTFVEQVTINKGVIMTGAGKELTSIIKPPVVAPPPGSFTEIGIIQTVQNIGDVHIRDLSIISVLGTGVTPIILQSGGSVKNCNLQNGNQGIFFRVDPATNPAITTVLVENNMISAEYIGLNFAGTNLTVSLINNNIAVTNPVFSAGLFVGQDFGPIASFTASGNFITGYVTAGLQFSASSSSITQNSITGVSGLAIQKNGGNTVNATCNWYGSADAAIVVPKLSSGVTYSPWLSNGTDNDVAFGFQPVPGACNGNQNKFYVNDALQTGDVFTTAVGNDANSGIPSEPLLTINAALTKAQAGDSIYLDAGTFTLASDLTINKEVIILGTNYLLSPNSAADKKLLNPVRNAESKITNATLILGTNNISLQGLTFDPGVPIAVYFDNINRSNISLLRNRMIMNSANAAVRFVGLGGPTTNTASLISTNITINENRFERYFAGSGFAINASLIKNISITDNSFVVAGTTLRNYTVLNSGANGVNNAVLFSGNIVENATTVITGNRNANLQMTNNIIYNSTNALAMTNSLTESSTVQISNNILDGSGGIVPFINYTRSGGEAVGSSSVFKVENNTISGTAVAGTTILLGSMNVIFNNTVLNPSLIVRGNTISYGGNFSSVQGQFIRPIMLRGNLLNAVVEKNEITLNGTNLQPANPLNPLPVSPAITLYSDNGTASVIPSDAVINILNNKIQGFKHSFIVFDPSNGSNPFVGFGNLAAGIIVNVNNNSFTGDSISINNGTTSQSINANCNWYGAPNAATVLTKVSATTINYIPWLSNGTDNDVATGFQPVAGSCNGTPIVAVITQANNVTCNGTGNGSIDVTISGGSTPYSFAWLKDNVAGFSTLEDLSGLAPGTFQLVVADVNGSTATISAVITQPAILIASATGTNVNCFGGSNGSATVIASGGIAPYTYLWNNAVTSNLISGLISGTYTVTVTDANGCTAVSNYELTQPTQLTAVATGTSTACSNSASVTASGGTGSYSYLWSNGARTPAINNIAAGTYTVTVTDANGCTAVASVTVTANEAFNPAAQVTDVSCYGGANGTITVTNVNAVAPFQFSIDGIFFQPGSLPYTFNNLAAGTYTIAVRDANGCTGFVTKTITQPPLLTATLSNAISTCFGSSTGSISVNVTGGTSAYSYNWTGPNGYTSSQKNISHLATGNYTFTVTDSKGCTVILNVAVPTTNQVIVNPVVANIACKGESNGAILLNVFGGSGSGFTYLWSNAATTGSITNLGSGNYSVTITDIGSGCIITTNLTITQPASLVNLSASKTNATGCASLGTITVTGSGGTAPYQYRLDAGSYQSSASFTGLYAGNYTVWVKDANGCTKSSAVISITDNGSDQYESNNSKTQAKAINIATTINARIGIATDLDWFKFTTPAGNTTYTLSVTHGSVNYTFNMYPTSSNAAALLPVSTAPTSKSYALAGNTTYYVQVSGALSLSCYSLAVNAVVTTLMNFAAPEKEKIPAVEFSALSSIAYPNPHKGAFNIRIASAQEGKARIELFNTGGQKLAEKIVTVHKRDNNIVPFIKVRQETIFYRIYMGKYTANGKVIGIN